MLCSVASLRRRVGALGESSAQSKAAVQRQFAPLPFSFQFESGFETVSGLWTIFECLWIRHRRRAFQTFGTVLLSPLEGCSKKTSCSSEKRMKKMQMIASLSLGRRSSPVKSAGTAQRSTVAGRVIFRSLLEPKTWL